MSGIQNVTQAQRPAPADRTSSQQPASAPAPRTDAPARPDNFVERPSGNPPAPVALVAPRPRAEAETVSGTATPNAPIKDLSKVESKISIDKELSIDQLNVDLNVLHSAKGQLVVSLRSPSGKTAVIHNKTGGSEDNVQGKFDLSAFKGEPSKGEWTLIVEDTAKKNVGTLKGWTLNVTGTSAQPPPPPPPPAEGTTFEKTSSPNAKIEDNKTVASTIDVPEGGDIEQLQLNLDIAHTYRGDLTVKLTSPSGKTAVISDKQGGSADDLKGTFDLSQFKGEKVTGQWKLEVTDSASGDTGTLKSWGLKVTTKGEQPPPPPPVKGEPIVVVFDGGVDVKHTDLDDSLWTNKGEVEGDGIDNDNNGVVDDVHGFNVGDGSGDPSKGRGVDHGTHVAGIIGAEDNGVGSTGFAAGKAKVMAVGGMYDGKDLLTNFEKGVDYVVGMKKAGNNVRVVNASFGDEYKTPEEQARWRAAVQKLADNDILLVAATANGMGSNMNDVSDMPANLDLPNVVTVAAMDRNNDKLASFSSYGDKVVELAAVGENVLSTVPGDKFKTMSGTSMATPTVAAAAALVAATNPDLTATQIRQILLDSVDKDSDLTGKVSTGGKLNIQAAVELAKKTLPAPGLSQSRDWFLGV